MRHPNNERTKDNDKKVEFENARNLMDNDICDRLNAELAPCTDEEFYKAYCAYCKAHFEKYGEEFEVN